MSKSSLAFCVAASAAFGFLTPAAAQAGQCRDPWITQAIHEVTGRWPNADYESGECQYTQYGGGHWGSYAELKGYVQARLGGPSLGRPSFPASGQALSLSAFNALPKQTRGGQNYVFYNGQWAQILVNGGGSMRLLNQDGSSIAVDHGANAPGSR